MPRVRYGPDFLRCLAHRPSRPALSRSTSELAADDRPIRARRSGRPDPGPDDPEPGRLEHPQRAAPERCRRVARAIGGDRVGLERTCPVLAREVHCGVEELAGYALPTRVPADDEAHD